MKGTTLPRSDDHAFAGGPVWAVASLESRPLSWPLAWFAALIDAVERNRMAELAAAFRERAVLGEDVRISAAARIVNRNARETVRIGSHTVLRGILRNEAEGELSIGDEVYFGDGSLISSASRVHIGSRTLVAHGVQVFDNASHPIDAAERARHFRAILGIGPKVPFEIPSDPVSVGEGCWLCAGSILLPGTRVGDGSIVSAGSVVRGEVPAGVVYSTSPGNPEIKPIRAGERNRLAEASQNRK